MNEESGYDDAQDEEFHKEGENESPEDKEMYDQIEREMNAYLELPIYKKAENIYTLTEAIAGILSGDAELFDLKEEMIFEAGMLQNKIGEIHCTETYNGKMENAVVLKMHASRLLQHVEFCELENFCDSDFLNALEDEIEKFRLLFIEWVGKFEKEITPDPETDIDDEEKDWGLFR
jgi:hypothetical protein